MNNDTLFTNCLFDKFINELMKPIKSHQELFLKIRTAIGHLVDTVHIGMVELRLDTPKNPLLSTEIHDNVIIYKSEEGFEELSQKETFTTGENGTVTITFHSKLHHTWTEEEKHSIKFIAKHVFLFSSRFRMEFLLNKVGTTDPMTSLPNLAGYMQFGDILIKKGIITEYCAYYFNIKNFKYVNKVVGHNEANQILINYCSIVKNFLKDDEILARLGGDNFVALVKKERTNTFLDFLSDIHINVNTPEIGKKEFIFGAVSGIWMIDSPTISMSDAMNTTSIAFYVAKHVIHRNYAFFAKEMYQKIVKEKGLAMQFRKSLKNKEFIVVYQPKVNLNSKQLCGAEALSRWLYNGELLPPDNFIPILEIDGSLCELDFYVLEKVCKDLRNWLNLGLKIVRISVNFSKWHLQNPNLVNVIMEILNKYNIDPKYIEVELTETANYSDYMTLSDIINKLKYQGLTTSIDDFGTGYSSLNLLKYLYVDIIKLDKSFLCSNDFETERWKILIKNVIRMANELGIDIISEGVETVQQMEFLKSINCNMVQGFLFDRPLSDEDFRKRLDESFIYKI